MTMRRREFNKILGAAAVAPVWVTPVAGATPDWSLAANIAECCSCAIPCPCNFGRPTSLRCDGNRLVEIYEGHIEGVKLAGIRFLVTFEMGKWSRIYIDESLDDAHRSQVLTCGNKSHLCTCTTTLYVTYAVYMIASIGFLLSNEQYLIACRLVDVINLNLLNYPKF